MEERPWSLAIWKYDVVVGLQCFPVSRHVMEMTRADPNDSLSEDGKTTNGIESPRSTPRAYIYLMRVKAIMCFSFVIGKWVSHADIQTWFLKSCRKARLVECNDLPLSHKY